MAIPDDLRTLLGDQRLIDLKFYVSPNTNASLPDVLEEIKRLIEAASHVEFSVKFEKGK